ncbi:putative uncharacterized protein [Firmicutes bacterium CAG:238]|nr:putative uncharacterized protein [Firmicutes bacterium CAG:238]
MDATKAVAAIAAVKSTDLTGTPFLLILAKNFGASPLSAICCMVLEAAYMEEFPQDNTEVRITAFIKDAAAANPAFLKMIVNGDAATLSSLASSREGSVNGIKVATTKIVPR